MFPFALLLHLHRLWTTSWWKQTRMQTDSNTGLSLLSRCSRLAWHKLAPRGRTQRCHGWKEWLMSLAFNELLQCRTGVRAAKPFRSYFLQETQVHCVKGQGQGPPLMVELQLKGCFFHWGLFGISEHACLLPLACGLREGKRPPLPWLLQYFL